MINVGLKKAFRKLMLLNELGGAEADAYKLTLCNAGVSGYSFGLIQMDLSTGEGPRKVFRKAMLGAGAPGSFTEDIIRKTIKPGKTLTSDEIKKVNEYFTKAGAKKVIDNSFEAYFVEYSKRIEDLVKAASNTEQKKKFLGTLFAQLFLCDFHNQFNIGYNGRTQAFVVKEQELHPGSFLKYQMTTKYARDKDCQQRDLIRRFGNVILCSDGKLTLTELEKADFENIFMAYPNTKTLKPLVG